MGKISIVGLGPGEYSSYKPRCIRCSNSSSRSLFKNRKTSNCRSVKRKDTIYFSRLFL